METLTAFLFVFLFVLVALLVWTAAAIGPLLVFRWVSRRLVSRALTRPPSEVRGIDGVFFPLMGTLFACVLLPVAQLLGPVVGTIAVLLGVACFVLALLMNEVPSHPRNVKYAAYLVGSSLIANGYGALAPTWTVGVLQLLLALFGLATGVVLVALLRPDAPLAAGDGSSSRALRWHPVVTWIQGTDPLSIAVWALMSFTPLGQVYLIARWCIKARVGRHSVVYLRSFHYQDAGKVFASVVAPAIYRSVPITGLVHTTQPTGELERDIPYLWRSAFACIADAQWQDWVQHHVDRSLAVIIDVSVNTGSVAWEVERVTRGLPAERILVMHARGTPAPSGSFTTLAYDLDAAPEARAAAGVWLGKALASYDPSLAGRSAPVTPVRWQIPTAVAMYAVTASVPFTLVSLVAWALLMFTFKDAQDDAARLGAERLGREVEIELIRRRDCPTAAGLGAETDPWRTPMRIRCEPTLEVRSAGRDRIFDSEDDVTYPDSARRP